MNTNFLGICAGLAMTALVAIPRVCAQQSGKPSVKLDGVWLLSERGMGRSPQSVWSPETLPFTAKGLEVFYSHHPGSGPRQAQPEEMNDPTIEANPPGLYRSFTYGRPIEFMQTPEKVVQLFSWNKVWRTIYTDGRPVPDDVPAGPFWYGYSVGKWEGETLVVTTLGLDPRGWLDQWGTPISEDARVVERWQRTGDKVQLTITVNDPTTYSKPWTSRPFTYTLQKKDIEPEEIISAPMDEKTFNENMRIPAGFKQSPQK